MDDRFLIDFNGKSFVLPEKYILDFNHPSITSCYSSNDDDELQTMIDDGSTTEIYDDIFSMLTGWDKIELLTNCQMMIDDGLINPHFVEF